MTIPQDSRCQTDPRRELVDKLRQLLPTSAVEELIRDFEHAVTERQRQWLLNDGYGPDDCVCESCSWCLATEYINHADPRHEEYQPWKPTT